MIWKDLHPEVRFSFVAFLVLAFFLPTNQVAQETDSPAGDGSIYGGPSFGSHWLIPGLDLQLIWCKPGSFLMGSPDDELGRIDDEVQHSVRLTEGFWLGKLEVNQAQWESVMGFNRSQFQALEGNPVESVSWIECIEYCDRLTVRERAAGRLPEGYFYSLPTEAQWEYACRAGGELGKPATARAAAWFADNSVSRTHPVGTKEANEWGFHDLYGNVWEWCYDWYWDYGVSEREDPIATKSIPGRPKERRHRVYRGGGWESSELSLRAAKRRAGMSTDRHSSLGFRVSLRSSASRQGKAGGTLESVRSPVFGESWVVPGAQISMIWIPPGGANFKGKKGGEEGRQPRPPLEGYWLGRLEVTQSQWLSVMGINPSRFRGATRQAPVETVSWRDCQEFCNIVNAEEKKAGRLPSGYVYGLPLEAQWEHACRGVAIAFNDPGGGSSLRWKPEGNLRKFAWFRENSRVKYPCGLESSDWAGKGGTHVAGELERNPWGFHDILGNVAEWCDDRYGENRRVARGGSWADPAEFCDMGSQRFFAEEARLPVLGFRLALRPER